jgi:DNA-binding IclR family transcriptional regulator
VGTPPARAYYATRTVRALELAAAGPLTAPALAAELRVDARTARRLLGRLAADGMLRRLDGRARRYVAGPRLLALARALGDLTAHDPAHPRRG